MPLKLMYITNRTEVAEIADITGVDRIFIDLEYIGKEDRQQGLDTVKSHHTISDILKIKKVLKNAELMVRVNPIHEKSSDFNGSDYEINSVIEAGADLVMLPMYRSVAEIEKFLKIIDSRVKTQLLAETPEACGIMKEAVSFPEVDEIHIGLNDLHLAYHKKFMFELLADGTVDKICNDIKKSQKPFGFGGIARIGYGILPAEYIIKEHYRIGSTRAILSRSFCNADKVKNAYEIKDIFEKEILKIRNMEKAVLNLSDSELEENRLEVIRLTKEIVKTM